MTSNGKYGWARVIFSFSDIILIFKDELIHAFLSKLEKQELSSAQAGMTEDYMATWEEFSKRNRS